MSVYATDHSPVPKKSINSLPKEILLNIFEEVYLASRDIELDICSELDDPRLFPQCILKVCKAWEKLLKSVPHFSTRISIFVDKPVSLSELAVDFRLSKALHIKVFVIRSDYNDVEDILEKGRVEKVMQVLVRHITRCQVVVFDLLYNSSLPRITDFSGTAPKLRTLRMKCRIPWTLADVVQPSLSIAHNPKPFICPSLQYLDLDGRVFIAALSIPGWNESIRMLARKRLIISDMSYPDGQDFDLHDLLVALSKIGHLTILKLTRVDLDARTCVGRNSPSLFIQNFEFEDLKRDFISEFFSNHENRIDVSSILLVKCQIGPLEYLNCWKLTLRGVAEEDDITDVVRHWNGFALTLEDCPSLDDRLLSLLSDFQPSGDTFFAPTLRELNISSCGSISVKALKGLVFAREIESVMHDPESEGMCLPMFSISVVNAGLETVTPDDQKWFCSKLENFYWCNPTPASCESPILDWDCSQWDLSQFNDFELANLDSQESRQHSPPSSPVISQDYSLIEWAPEDLQGI